MTKTQVCYLITELDVGGAERTLARLLAHMDRDRFAFTVACFYGSEGPVAEEIRALGVPVVDLRMAHKWHVDAFWRLYRLLSQRRPAILHTWLFHANIAGRVVGRLAHVPIIINSERTMGMESRLRYGLNRVTQTLADRVVCVSQQVADFVVNQVGISQRKAVVIPNGLDLSDFERLPDRQEAREALGLASDQVWIGTVARLDPVKQLDVFLHALPLLEDVRALIVGHGPEERRLETLARQLGIKERVCFTGYQGDARPWLAALDVFVLSSDWEGMSNALLEAMAAGLPAVATAVGGTPDVVARGRTGLLVPPRDPRALAEAVEILVRDPDLRSSMGRAGRQRVAECFSVEQMVERTQALYEELLGEQELR